jgi:hypothetical protein
MATFIVVFIITVVVLAVIKVIKKGGQPDKENGPIRVQTFVNGKPLEYRKEKNYDIEAVLPNVPVTIKYSNYESENTTRDIEIKKIILSSNRDFIEAFCHLRNEDRTFKIENIQEAYKDGNRIEIRSFLRSFLDNQPDVVKRAFDSFAALDKVFSTLPEDYERIKLDNIPMKIKYHDRNSKGAYEKELTVDSIGISGYGPGYYITNVLSPGDSKRSYMVSRILYVDNNGKHENPVDYLADICLKSAGYSQTMKRKEVWESLDADTVKGKEAIALVYLARLDGRFMKKEKDAIAQYILETIDNKDIDIDLIINTLGNIEPRVTEYKRAARDIPLSEKFMETARYIAGKDPVKKAAIETLLKKKNRPAASDLANEALKD